MESWEGELRFDYYVCGNTVFPLPSTTVSPSQSSLIADGRQQRVAPCQQDGNLEKLAAF